MGALIIIGAIIAAFVMGGPIVGLLALILLVLVNNSL